MRQPSSGSANRFQRFKSGQSPLGSDHWIDRATFDKSIWLNRALLACGLVAPLVMAVFVVAVAEATPGYNPVTDTVSHFAAQGAPHGEFMAIGLFVVGLLIDAFAIGLSRFFVRGGVAVWASLSVHGTALALSGIARNYGEYPGAPRNLEGFLHNVFGIVVALGLTSSMVCVAVAAHWTPGWHRLTTLSLIAAAVVALGGLVFLRVPQPDHGLVERLTYLVATAWYVALSVAALQTSRICVAKTSSRR
jgi:hypothetical membrane protein